MLTITISIASGADAIFSFLPPDCAPPTSSPVAFAGLALLTVMNLRGVKESVTALVPDLHDLRRHARDRCSSAIIGGHVDRDPAP